MSPTSQTRRLLLGLLLSFLILGRPDVLAQTLTPLTDLPGTWAGNVVWADVDGDGDPDLLITGKTGPDDACASIARIYINSSGSFAESSSNLIGFAHGDAAFADYDGDGDLDLALSGLSASGGFLSLFENINGTFIEDLTQVDLLAESLRYSALAWGDIDGDGDFDLAASGMTAAGNARSVLFRNTRIDAGRVGSPLGGAPRLVLDGPNSDRLINLNQGNLAWGDVDGDGDLDLAASGYGSSGARQTVIYVNDPPGTLTQDTRNSIEAVSGGDLAWGDIDNDGDLDLALSGWNNDWESTLAVYTNAAGILRENRNLSAVRVNGALTFADYDADGDLDLSVSGQTSTSEPFTIVLRNDPVGTLEQDTGLDLDGQRGGSMAWADIDGDGRLDLAVSGEDSAGTRRTRIYESQGGIVNTAPEPPDRLGTPFATSDGLSLNWNDGSDAQSTSSALTYILQIGTSPGAHNVFSGALDVAPGNVGNAKTVQLGIPLARDTYYWTIRSVDGSFAVSDPSQEEVFRVQDLVSSRQNLRPLQRSALAWGDFDNDGDADLVLAGSDIDGRARSVLYENDNGTLIENSDVVLQGVDDGDVAWGDFDNDGDLDLVLTGIDGQNRYTHLYRNRLETGDFALNVENSSIFPQLSSGSAAFGDIDNDGDLDLALIGLELGARFAGLFVNEDGRYVNVGARGLQAVDNGDLAFADVDGDGDLDLAVAGQVDNNFASSTTVYRNDGEGLFTPGSESLRGVLASALAWGDADNDGDVDLVVSGFDPTSGLVSTYYLNDNGVFVDDQKSLTGVAGSDVAWGDFDNDGDADLAQIGQSTSGSILELYRNNGSSFGRESIDVLVGIDFGAVGWGDVDSDGDLELASSGRSTLDGSTFVPTSRVNDNLESRFNPNRAPAPPDLLTATTTGSRVDLSWSEGSDFGLTPPEALTYDLRLGAQSDGSDVVSGATPVAAGRYRGTSHGLHSLDSGRYFWSVRSVDQGLARSDWASEQTFIVDTIKPVVDSIQVSPRIIRQGRRASVVVSFSDDPAGMDNAVSPTVQLQLSGGGGPVVLNQVSYSGNLWIGEAEIEGEVAGGSLVVHVTGATDLKGNVMAPFQRVIPALLAAGVGGIVESADGIARAVITPNALPTLNVNPDVTLTPEPAVGLPTGLRLVLGPYLFASDPDFTLRKPATLSFALRGTPFELARTAVYRMDTGGWVHQGGTVDEPGTRIALAVSSFGTYALLEGGGPAGTPAITSIDFSNRAFSPRGAGSRIGGGQLGQGPLVATTDISFELGAPATVRIQIFNRSGQVERVLETGRSMNAGRNVVRWDGRDHNGDPARSGIYIVAIDADGVTAQKTVAVVNR